MNELSREIHNLQYHKEISFLQFGTLHPDELKRMSVCEITKAETFDGSKPVINGLFDPRMGVIERGPVCATCENTHVLCPGHFGHIELVKPVFYMHFKDNIKQLLNCVCFRCSRLLVERNNPKLLEEIKNKTREHRFKAIYKYCTKTQKTENCCYNEGCRIIQPHKYTALTSDKLRGMDKKINGVERDTVFAIIAEFKEEAMKDSSIPTKYRIRAEQCYEIFRKITDEDWEFLGFNAKYGRPECMICTHVCVPPPCVRPSVQRSSNQRSEDDLTYVLIMIIKANNQLRKKITQNEDIRKIHSAYECLQYNVTSLISNNIPGFPQNLQRSGKVIKDIIDRLRGKQGRIRGNIQGKRVNFSGRTVVSVDPNISIDEFGMPKKIAMILTFPEIVTEENMEEMKQIVSNGPFIHPGAKKIERNENDCFGNPSPCIINLKHIDTNSFQLQIGDIVHRHIKNGDTCLFNRQPSLHRMNMMGHKAIIVDSNTFKLNVFCCKPYNADFDGDEMNVFPPQSIQTKYELENLIGVKRQIISPATSVPIINVVQDSMIGSFLLSKHMKSCTNTNVFHYLSKINPLKKDFDIYEMVQKKEWTGLELFSTIFPEISFNNIITNTDTNTIEKGIRLENGKILQGIMEKSTLGGGGKSIVQSIIQEYGPLVCRDFLDNLQRLVISWVEDHGFSIGFGDAISKKNISSNIQEIIQKHILESEKLIESAHLGLYEPFLRNSIRIENLESDIINIGNTITKKVEELIFNNADSENNFIKSVVSGTKGKEENLNQIMGVVGQRDIHGKRIRFGFNGRTLPHYTKFDNGLISKGYVINSYMNGLTPSEFFFTAMSSRIQAVDTKIKTAETGYIQRRLIKAMEDLQVAYDGSVRDASNNIVQFVYGRDQLDPIQLEHVPFTIQSLTNIQLDKEYKWDLSSTYKLAFTTQKFVKLEKEKEEIEKVLEEEYTQIVKDREDVRHTYSKYKETKKIISPVNIISTIYNIRNKFSIQDNNTSDCDPRFVIQKIRELIEYINSFTYNVEYSPLLKIYLRTCLSTKQCIIKYRLPTVIVEHVFSVIKTKITNAIINPGEMVGIIASQSLGEPITQLNLGAYHFSGGTSKESVVTNKGIPRIEEITRLSKNTKTQSMTIYLKPEFRNNKEIATELKNQLEYTRIGDIVSFSEILFLPDKFDGKTQEEKEEARVFYEISQLTNTKCADINDLSNWVLRIEFDRELMLKKNITTMDIYEKVIQTCNVDTDIQCVISNMNSEYLSLRIRVTQVLSESESYDIFFQNIGDEIMSIRIRGIENIEKVLIQKNTNMQNNYLQDNVYHNDGTHAREEEWMLQTRGSNLRGVLSNPFVDTEKTTTNNIIELYDIYGIEGIRSAIIRELQKVISGSGTDVNIRHYLLLADFMTYCGTPLSIWRNGFIKSPYISTVSKSTFEEMDKILIRAGLFSHKDMIKGVSSSIMVGQAIKAGTNSFELLIDKDMLLDKEKPVSYKNVNSVSFDEYMNNIQKNTENTSTHIENKDLVFGYSNEDQYPLSSIDISKIEVSILTTSKK